MTAPAAGRAEDVLERVLAWRSAGSPAAVATVLRTWGSSPRPAGSQLGVNAAREFVGSVSGGCVEGAVIDAALQTMEDGIPRTLEFGVPDEDAWAVGLACGGRVSIYVEAVGARQEALFRELLGDRAEQRAGVLVTRLADGEETLLHPLETPGQDELHDAALRALLEDKSQVISTDAGEVFLNAHNPPLQLILVGAVHIAQVLAPMARLAGFDVTVTEPRRAFASPSRFPDVRVLPGWPQEILPGLRIDHRTAVVTLSHDAKVDDPALEVALKSPAFYVGALGSRRTHAGRTERLLERGFTASDIARIHAPVGLSIGAVTPGEIAVSILGQVVERLRARSLPAAP